MKALTILLPDPVKQLVFGEATRQNVDAATLCSGIIAEHFLVARQAPVVSRAERPDDDIGTGGPLRANRHV